VTIDASLLEIAAPDATHHADMRSAVAALDDALSHSWNATGEGSIVTHSGERLIILPAFSQWIGAAESPPLGADLLRLVRDLCVRALEGDVRHPEAASYACTPHDLAEAMMLVSVGRVPAHAPKPTLIAELANPFGAPRVHWRRAGSGSPRSHLLSDPAETGRWATLAPPGVGLFVTRNSIEGGRMVDHVTIGLVMRQFSMRLDRLRGRPMDVLRATALLASVGEPS
jgi:hypothetical protein